MAGLRAWREIESSGGNDAGSTRHFAVRTLAYLEELENITTKGENVSSEEWDSVISTILERKDGDELDRELTQLSYLLHVVRYYRPKFDSYSVREKLDLAKKAHGYVEDLLRPLKKLQALLEYGAPNRNLWPMIENPQRVVRAAVLTPDYDQFSNLPDWAKETLKEHAGDHREYVYAREQLENAETHDEYWNAAMNEMRHTGYMHNYMRMYWGKKILEWSEAPEEAYETALYLNNKYFVDGRDPNSYANVAWVFGQHDRGWQERAVFGKVRYMSAGGLERKAKPKQYVEKVGERIEDSE